MGRWRVPDILIGAILTVAAFGLGWSFAELSWGRGPDQTTETKEQKHPESLADFAWEWVSKPDAYVALFTGILAFYTFSLVREGREHSRRELRAYLGIHTVTLTVPPDRSWITVVLELKNTGQTPARHVRLSSGWALEPLPFDEMWVLEPTAEGAKGTINPGGFGYINHLASHAVDPIVEPEELAEVLIPDGAGNLGFWVYGKITFVDVFDEPQWVTFRYRLRKYGTLSPSMSPTDVGNDAS